MPEQTIDSGELVQLLESGCVILTPNHRTAVQVHETYGQFRRVEQKPRIAPSPAIYPIDIWLKQRFLELFEQDSTIEPLSILDSYQELSFWKKVIRDSAVKNPLLNLQNAAPRVMEAYRLSLQWQIPLDEFKPFQSSRQDQLDDCTAFLEWVKLYRQRCKLMGLTSFAEQLQQLLRKLTKTQSNLPDKIIALGFAEPPPLYQSLFRQLQEQCQLEFRQWQQYKPTLRKFSIANTTEEIRASAQWSRQILEDNPQARIGIVCNELQEHVPTLKRLFRDSYETAESLRQAWFIQSESGICQDIPALKQLAYLLKFNLRELSTLDACCLLRCSILLASEEESSGRAAMEFYLRNRAESIVRSADLRFFLGQNDMPWSSPLLHQALLDCEKLNRQQQKYQKLTDWVELFEQQFERLVWPINTSGPNIELLRTYCSEAFRQLKLLDFILGTVSITEALSQFEEALLNLSNREYRQESPVQILYAKDADGLQFTHVWFMGLSDTQWPPIQHSNPFIPFPLKRKYFLPNSFPQLSYQNALNSLQGIRDNTRKEVVFSFPRSSEFGDQSPSAVFLEFGQDIDIITIANNHSRPLLQKQSIQIYREAQKQSALESYTELNALTLHPEETLHGGVTLIQDQAECPFRAFALHRLKSKELPAITYGIPAKDLGSMLHRVLEKLWQRLQNSTNLQHLTADQQNSIINESVSTGLSYLSKKHPRLMRPRYVELEHKRLYKLMDRWLAIEKQRAPFSVISHEFGVNWQHAGLTLKFRIDRIDQSEHGYVLVDYKSGTNNLVTWIDERPSAPQLLLYNDALFQEGKYQPVNALLFAQVNIGSLEYRGISSTADTYPKTSLREQKKYSPDITWRELQDTWKESLQNMANEFLAGYCAVQPKDRTSCQYCHLDAFCRIQEKLEGETEKYELSHD
jgi:ATP-dependent helicase/nuclease subunit B